MSGKFFLLITVLMVAASSCVSSKAGRPRFKFPLPPPPPPPGCVHRGLFYEVGETFADKWCRESCVCKDMGVTVCRPICPMEWVECGEGLQPEIYQEPVLGGLCSCPRHVCVEKK